MVKGLKRLSNGGIEMTLAYREDLQDKEGFEKQKLITITADCWGTINRLEEKETRIIAIQSRETAQ
jgi:hypothetical protein